MPSSFTSVHPAAAPDTAAPRDAVPPVHRPRRQRRGLALVLTVVYLAILQAALPYLVPGQWVYHHRLRYEAVKDNMLGIDAALDQVRLLIDQNGWPRYLLLLGDSVGYSGPGGPEQSIGVRLTAVSGAGGRPLPVINLALPAMQTGDIYTMILKLRERGISTDHLVINLIYGGFVQRQPDPPVVFWLADELRRLDPAAHARVRAHLAANGRVPEPQPIQDWVREHVTSRIALFRYRDYLRAGLLRASGLQRLREVYDTRPWHEKPTLPAILAAREYQMAFDPARFVMDPSNPQVYFLEQIIAATRGQQVFFYLSPVNQQLMAEQVGHPGYQANLRRVEAWFADQPVGFANLEAAMDQQYFADHLHMTPAGYERLAHLLWERLQPLLAEGGAVGVIP